MSESESENISARVRERCKIQHHCLIFPPSTIAHRKLTSVGPVRMLSPSVPNILCCHPCGTKPSSTVLAAAAAAAMLMALRAVAAIRTAALVRPSGPAHARVYMDICCFFLCVLGRMDEAVKRGRGSLVTTHAEFRYMTKQKRKKRKTPRYQKETKKREKEKRIRPRILIQVAIQNFFNVSLVPKGCPNVRS